MKPVRFTCISIMLYGFLLIQCTNTASRYEKSVILSDSVYYREGERLVSLTFDTLRRALTTTISEKGLVYAIQFCSEAAYPITAAYTCKDISIRRAADRYRNPRNQADSLEIAMLEIFRSQNKSPRILRKDGEVHFVKPIFVQGMCLYCHGLPEKEIQPEVYSAIKEKYPADRATGYREGDLRGLWHVVFKTKIEKE